MSRPFTPVALALHEWVAQARHRGDDQDDALVAAYDMWASEPVDRMYGWSEGTRVVLRADVGTWLPGRFVRPVDDAHGNPPWALIELEDGTRGRYRAAAVAAACACGRLPRPNGRCPRWWWRCS